MTAIRVLLADDHVLLRAGIRAIVQGFDGIEVAGEAGDGREALRLVETLRPHVLLIDISMPGLNGLDVAARVAGQFPGVRVIILSMHETKEYVFHALRAGAAGYLLKDASPAELELAIRAVMRGENYLSPAISRHVVGDYVRRVAAGEGTAEELTTRQREVLQLIAEGDSTKDIARKLNLSVKTVETHRAQLMQRLGIHDVAGLVRYAIRIGLTTPDR